MQWGAQAAISGRICVLRSPGCAGRRAQGQRAQGGRPGPTSSALCSQGHDDDGLRPVCHHQALGDPEQGEAPPGGHLPPGGVGLRDLTWGQTLGLQAQGTALPRGWALMAARWKVPLCSREWDSRESGWTPRTQSLWQVLGTFADPALNPTEPHRMNDCLFCAPRWHCWWQRSSGNKGTWKGQFWTSSLL